MFNFTTGTGDGFCYAYFMDEQGDGTAFSLNVIFMADTGKVLSYYDELPF